MANTELRGRLPYNVDGIVSMQRGERVRFLPGAFTDSLAGGIILLAGNSYEEPLASSLAGTLTLRDTDEALEFQAKRLPRTRYAEDFLGKLSAGLVRGLTAGWADAGSDTTTEDLPDGGKRHRGPEGHALRVLPAQPERCSRRRRGGPAAQPIRRTVRRYGGA